MTRDARLSALHRGGFGLPGPRFRLLGRPPSYNGGQLPCGSVQRAPRTQVVVPGGRGPCLPRRAVTRRRRGTPRLAPHSGSSLKHALNEQGCIFPSTITLRSQEGSYDVVKLFFTRPRDLGLLPLPLAGEGWGGGGQHESCCMPPPCPSPASGGGDSTESAAQPSICCFSRLPAVEQEAV